jgi:NADH dehydrogenase
VRNRFSTLATWFGAIARSNRTDRTFLLGNTASAEQPYTWANCDRPKATD